LWKPQLSIEETTLLFGNDLTGKRAVNELVEVLPDLVLTFYPKAISVLIIKRKEAFIGLDISRVFQKSKQEQ
jgi:hypothetical protein